MDTSDPDLLLNYPSKVVKNIYEKNHGILHHLNEVGVHFRNALNNDFTKIPCINEMPLEKIKAKSLVRYRGMIQDMFDPEFYLGTFETVNIRTNEKIQRIGCYTDFNEAQDEEIDFNSPKNVTLERQTYYCVPVPGENHWVKSLYTKGHKGSDMPTDLSVRNKREHDDVMEDDEVMEEEIISENDKLNLTKDEIWQKKAKTDDQNTPDTDSRTQPAAQTEFLRNFPLPGENGPGCFVKMYSQDNGLKLNDVCEFICILSVDPILATPSLPNGNDIIWSVENSIEEKAHSPPPSLVPRLHCLFFKKIETLNPSILLKDDLYESVSKELCSIRGDLLQLLSNIFGGDTVLAEFFLFHLISRVYGRCGAMCIGKISLNVLKCPSGGAFTEMLYKFLQSIVEKSHYIPLTLTNLNNGKFIPKKDYDANRLISGQLQLPSELQLILDETKMQNGQLDSNGVHNITAIGNLIQWQKVEYDFKFHKLNMDTNVNVLILSEGKSMLTCDCQVPIVSDEINEEKIRNLISGLSEKLLERIRLYLSIVKRLDYNLTDEIQKALQDDFVEMRKQDPQMTADSFYLLLTTARYMALSYGQTTLSSSLWIRTKDLDSTRRKRLRNL